MPNKRELVYVATALRANVVSPDCEGARLLLAGRVDGHASESHDATPRAQRDVWDPSCLRSVLTVATRDALGKARPPMPRTSCSTSFGSRECVYALMQLLSASAKRLHGAWPPSTPSTGVEANPPRSKGVTQAYFQRGAPARCGRSPMVVGRQPDGDDEWHLVVDPRPSPSDRTMRGNATLDRKAIWSAVHNAFERCTVLPQPAIGTVGAAPMQTTTRACAGCESGVLRACVCGLEGKRRQHGSPAALERDAHGMALVSPSRKTVPKLQRRASIMALSVAASTSSRTTVRNSYPSDRASRPGDVRRQEPVPLARQVPSLAGLLNDTNEHVRRAALCQLAMIGIPAASTAALVAFSLRDKVPHVRAAAALALGSFGNAASPFVMDLMRLRLDRDLCVRSTACRALLRLKMPAELLFAPDDDSDGDENAMVADLFHCGVTLDFDPLGSL